MKYVLLFYLFLFSYPSASATLNEKEKLSSQAGTILKHLGSYLEGEMEEETFSVDLADDWSMTIQYSSVSPVTVPGGLSFTPLPRLKPQAGKEVRSLSDLRSSLKGTVERTKFKIVRIQTDPKSPGTFTTRQLVSFFIRSPEGYKEINTEWKALWRVDQENVLLVSLQGTMGQEAQLHGGGLIFQDQTDSLLRLNEKENPVLHYGANHWMQRLETALKPEFFALSGLSVADVNGDGREDVYLCQLGGLPNFLFIQQADGTFVNQAKEAGLDFFDNTTCALFVDFDNDGDQDLAVATSSGVGIYENDSHGKFQRKSLNKAFTYSYSLCAADYDRDGLVDLYVCQYYGSRADRKNATSVQGSLPVPHPVYDANNGGRNALFKNTGELSFNDVTQAVGLNIHNTRFTYSAIWEDWDNDGDQDLYVVNDFGQNNYYRNDGGKFKDVSKSIGLGMMEFSMGVTSGDYNGDGWMDLYVSNMFSSAGSRVTRQPAFKTTHGEVVKKQFQLLARGNNLTLNLGHGTFKDVSVASGVTIGRWSWASSSPDINNDGYEDILVANGFVTGKKLDDL